jgi:hypothetical protein
MSSEKLSKTYNSETNLKQIHLSESWVPLDSMTYRGITVNFYEDCIGHQVVTMWKDKVIEFGVYNTVYQDDMKMIIDDHLDTITRFSEYPEFHGSKLTWFQNGSFSDVKLLYRGRILKVYIDVNENDLFSIVEDAKKILLTHNSIKITLGDV